MCFSYLVIQYLTCALVCCYFYCNFTFLFLRQKSLLCTILTFVSFLCLRNVLFVLYFTLCWHFQSFLSKSFKFPYFVFFFLFLFSLNSFTLSTICVSVQMFFINILCHIYVYSISYFFFHMFFHLSIRSFSFHHDLVYFFHV